MSEEVIVNTDGGARGNPGPAACAFAVSVNGRTVYKTSKFLGVATNNQAEYRGAILALTYLFENPNTFSNKKIVFVLDSEVVARQLAGLYKTKEEGLKSLLTQAKLLERKIDSNISYTVTSREKNKLADFLVNQELDNSLKISRS
jgi:ribonuclease HI